MTLLDLLELQKQVDDKVLINRHKWQEVLTHAIKLTREKEGKNDESSEKN